MCKENIDLEVGHALMVCDDFVRVWIDGMQHGTMEHGMNGKRGYDYGASPSSVFIDANIRRMGSIWRRKMMMQSM